MEDGVKREMKCMAGKLTKLFPQCFENIELHTVIPENKNIFDRKNPKLI